VTQAFTIDHIERRGDETIVCTPDEPGIAVEPGLVRMTCFPCWGLTGETRFRISAAAVTRQP